MVSDNQHIDAVHAVLKGIPDPELPCSIVELGLVEEVRVEEDGRVHIVLLPTFSGCPALDMIGKDVQQKVSALDCVSNCIVEWTFEPAWTTDRINEDGRASLARHGVTVPPPGEPFTGPSTTTLRTSAIPCPWCGSTNTRLDSPFGPTRCRTIQYCDDCQNTFEDMKRLAPGGGDD